MKIKSVSVYRKNLALTKPYTIAFKTISDVENIFLEIELENGMIGKGAANPAPEVVGETPDQTFENLESEFVQRLKGQDIRHFNQLIDVSAQLFPRLPGTLAAIDIALHDAFCQYLGVPVAGFYGIKIKSLSTSVTIGIKNVEETMREAAEYEQQGFKALKVKTGVDVDEDADRIMNLYGAYKNRMQIRVDANQGYTLADLKRFMEKIKGAEIELIEQPLPVGSEKELLDLPAEVRKTLAADESLKNAAYALQLAQHPQPFGIFNVKLMKCGGIKGAMEIASVARNAKIDLFWGCNDESKISIAAALHAAYANEHTKYIDLDGSFDLKEDVAGGGFLLKDGRLEILDAPGLGLTN